MPRLPAVPTPLRPLALLAALALAAALPSHARAFDSDRLAATASGEGPDVVLLAGLGASGAVWDGVLPALAGHRVHRLDVRGFAGLPPDANAAAAAEGALLDALADEVARYAAEAAPGAVLVGHSMGGTLALAVAARADLAGVVVVDAPPAMGAVMAGPDAGPEAVRAMADGMRAGMEAADNAGWRAQAEAFAGGAVHDPAGRALVLNEYLASDRAVLTDAFHELMLRDLRPLLPEVAEPVALIYATSPAGPEGTDAFYARETAPLHVVLARRIDGAGHYLMLDAPDAFAAALDAALDAL